MNRSSKNEYKCNEVVHHTLHDVLFRRISNQKNCTWARAARDRFFGRADTVPLESGAQLLIGMDGFGNTARLQASLHFFITKWLPHGHYAGTFEELSKYCPLPPGGEDMVLLHQGSSKGISEVAIDAFLVLAVCFASAMLAVLLSDARPIDELDQFEEFLHNQLDGIELTRSRGIQPVWSMATLAAQFRDYFNVDKWIEVAKGTWGMVARNKDLDSVRRDIENKGVQRVRIQESIPEEPMRQRPMSSNSGGGVATNEPAMPDDPLMPGAMDWRTQSRRQQRKPTAKPKKAGVSQKKKAAPAKKKKAVRKAVR